MFASGAFAQTTQSPALGAFERWEMAARHHYANTLLSAATVGLEYRHFILSMKETQELLSTKAYSADLQKELLRRMALLAEDDKNFQESPRQFYGYLYCDLAGMDAGALLRMINTHESRLHVVLAVLFCGRTLDLDEVIFSGFGQRKK
jgi:hypothetical protein